MKYWISLLIIIFLGSNAFWILSAVDNGVTCMYSDASFESTEKAYRQSIILANLDLIGKPADDAIASIGKDVYGLDPFEKEGCIYAGQVCLRLNENRIVVGLATDAL